jgi:xanthine/CO dehydrogenase XdhC/CoxF family maturation factor
MVSGQLAYVSYNAENGFDLMVETGCGGELDVVVEPLTSLSLGFLGSLDDALASQRSFRVVTDFPAAGDASSTVRRIEMLEANEGSCAGDTASSEFRSDGTAVLTEQFDAPVSLIIAGAGTQSADLAIIASQLGWRGVIVDPSVERIAAMALAVPGWSAAPVRPEALMDALRVSEATALVAMTHHLDVDVAYLRAGEAYGAFYLGALGSRERARTIMSMVQSPVLHVPAGLDIGSNATTEISVSIVAEIMAVRSARDGTALSRRRGPIHGKKPAPLSLTA